MIRNILLLFLFSWGLNTAWSQEKVTLSGYIKDASNGETLIGATAYVRETQQGVTSNEYGFYSLSLLPGSYTIEYA